MPNSISVIAIAAMLTLLGALPVLGNDLAITSDQQDSQVSTDTGRETDRLAHVEHAARSRTEVIAPKPLPVRRVAFARPRYVALGSAPPYLWCGHRFVLILGVGY
jgi:hypothetical protein